VISFAATKIPKTKVNSTLWANTIGDIDLEVVSATIASQRSKLAVGGAGWADAGRRGWLHAGGHRAALRQEGRGDEGGGRGAQEA
jgi:hypothetical protein